MVRRKFVIKIAWLLFYVGIALISYSSVTGKEISPESYENKSIEHVLT